MKTLLGVYAGPPSRVSDKLGFLYETGLKEGIESEFFPGAESGDHTAMENAAWALDEHIYETEPTLPLDLAIPLLPKGDAMNGMTLGDVAAGALDATFDRIGLMLAARPKLPVNCRLGWEPQGTWYPWVAKNPEDYVAAWRRAASRIFLTPATDHVKFTWCVSNGRYSALLDPMRAYPGDKYVDTISVDFYDYSWLYSHDGVTDLSTTMRLKVWKSLVYGDQGLEWWYNKAREHGKPFAISEWGPAWRKNNQAGGDNPDFVHRTLDWILQHEVAWAIYFNGYSTEVDHRISPASKLPQSFEAFRSRMSALNGL